MIWLSITPVPKPRMTQRDRWAKRPAVERYYHFADELREQWEGEVPPMFRIVFMMPMPKSWSKKKRMEMTGRPHQQRPDVDNLTKAFLDALCEDDSYVYHVDAAKHWSEEGGIIFKHLDS